MKSTFNYKLKMTVAAMLLTPSVAFATNGYFGHGYGTKNKGMAGSGIALPQDTMIAATNPAGMVMVGARSDLGLALFSPSPRSYSATADGAGVTDGTVCGAACPFTLGGNANAQSIDSDGDLFLIPSFGYNWMLDSDSSVGITLYGNGGMNTEYAGGVAQHNDGTGTAVTTAGTFGAGTAGVNLEQLFLTTTYARKFNEGSSWGVSGIIAYQRFSATGLANFAGLSSSPGNLTNNGNDSASGFGLKLGIQSEVMKGLTLAASYQSKIDMSEFDKYSGLFAENGDFDIPSTWTVGLSWVVQPKSAITFDVQRINYGEVAAISNPFANLVGASATCTSGPTGGTGAGCLGGANGGGFGWQDMTIYKLGYQFMVGSDWTMRMGYSYGEQPIPSSEVLFNILAPAVIKEHVSLGFTVATSKTSELSFQYTRALKNSVTGSNPLNPSQNVTLEMSQNEAEVSWAWKF